MLPAVHVWLTASWSSDASPTVPAVALVLSGVSTGLARAASSTLGRAEGWIVVGWVPTSTTLVSLLLASALRLRRQMSRWPRRMGDGDGILVSERTGPAVVGLFRPRIVVPRWVLERGTESSGLILAHVREHCRARDPLLVLLGALPALLLSWTPLVWWSLVRLRLAVEIDCDARVLREASRGTRHRYGRLLVEVTRRPAGVALGITPFAEGRSLLERRIRALSQHPPERWLRRAVLPAFNGLLLAGLARVVPDPGGPDGLASEPSSLPTAPEPTEGEASSNPAFTPFTRAPAVLNAEEVHRTLEAEYPRSLREAGVAGSATVWLFVDDQGGVRDVRIQRSSGYEALDRAALRVAAAMRFQPAGDADRAVSVWIAIPVSFGEPSNPNRALRSSRVSPGLDGGSPRAGLWSPQ